VVSLSLRFPHQTPAHASPLPHTCYMLTHVMLLDLVTRIQFGEQYTSLICSLCRFLHSTAFAFPIRRNDVLVVRCVLNVFTDTCVISDGVRNTRTAHGTAVCRNQHNSSNPESRVTGQLGHKQSVTSTRNQLN